MPNLDKAETAIADLLTALDVDEGEHTHRTPQRVARNWADALAGYHHDPARHLATTFPHHGDPGLVIVAGVDLHSTCAHHMLPITGRATIAYRAQPDSPITGLSKLARVAQEYAARLQVQERLGQQIARCVADNLTTVGTACVITATHGCMSTRGVHTNAATTTIATTGGWDTTHPDVATTLTEHHAPQRQ